MRRALMTVIAAIIFSGCGALSPPSPTPRPTATDSASPTSSPSPLPSDTATPAPTSTPTASPTPTVSPTSTNTATLTLTPTPSSTPSITPLAVSGPVFDNWDVLEIPAALEGGIASEVIAFVSSNNRVTIRNIATAQPFTGIQTVYFASPARAFSRIPVLEVNSDARLEVFIARPGNALAYAISDGDIRRSGLYILDLASGFSARVMVSETPLVQRGFYMPPAWSPDGEHLAMAVATGYDMDIYLYAKDGSGRTPISDSGAYDLWPSWSPDGRSIAFVSDRGDCPSWRPGEPGFCDALTEPAPRGGQVYLYEVASGKTTRLADVTVFEAPYWINARLLAFASGDPFDLLNPQRRIWLADISTGDVEEIRLNDSAPSASYLSESWSPSGRSVLVQIADRSNQVVLLTDGGALIARDSELDFPRFSMTASWAPDGGRIAIGGTSGQCPYGIRVRNAGLGRVANGSPPPTMCDPKFSRSGQYIAFTGVNPAVDGRNDIYVASGNPPPTMCDPMFSPDGQYIAFTGVNPAVDGRNDIYVASPNGFGAVSLTQDLRGHVQLIGWVGG